MTKQAGDAFAQYEIVAQIGAGGMGEVFSARDSRLDRTVAIKFLPAEFSGNGDRLARFVREAKTASALNHPNIVTVYEIGETDGSHFISVEFIDGVTLRDRMRTERISFDEFLSIAIQTAEAISAAHKVGIVHRDIKPENVMLRSDGYVKVLDFGLAKLNNGGATSGPSDDETRKLVNTNPGVVLGTASYMSPEQARGKDVDARSDIFSLGVMMYEILAGQVPFKGDSMMDVISDVLHNEPPLLTTVAPHLPKELQRIVHKALRKKRDLRYQTAQDLLTDLKDLRDELQIESKLERTAVPSKSDGEAPVPSKISTGGFKDSLLLTEFDNSTGETIFDQTLKMALAFSLSQSPMLDILSDTAVAQTLRLMGRSPTTSITREIAEEICLRQGSKAFITGAITSFGSTYVLNLEAVNARTGESLAREFRQATSREGVLEALSDAASGLREKLGESLSSIEKFNYEPNRTTASLEALKMYSLAREQSFSGRLFDAVPFYEKAIEIDPNFVSAYIGLGVFYSNTGQVKKAAEYMEKAFEKREYASELEKMRVSFFYSSFVTGDLQKGLETLHLWRNTYPVDVIPLTNLSDLYERLGQSDKAVEAARAGIKMGADNAATHMNLAESLFSLGRFDEMKEACTAAFSRGLDNGYLHKFLYRVGYLENDKAMMSSELGWFSGRKEEYVAIDLESSTAGVRGKWRSCQDLSRRSIDMAARADNRETAARYAVDQAIRIAFWSSGTGLPAMNDSKLHTVVKTQLNKALALSTNFEIRTRACAAFALSGQLAEAKSLESALREERPKDTVINELWLPMARAAIELHNGRPKDAVEELEVAERYERAGECIPQYLRGLAFLKLERSREAVREFEKILNNRGQAALSSVYPLAQLAKARSLSDKAEYEKFFELWKDGDADMPALTAAKAEAAALA